MRFKNYEEVISRARTGEPVKVSVAAAHDEEVLVALKEAVELNMVEPYLIGDKNEILSISRKIGFDINKFEIIATDTVEEAAFVAAKLADEGKTQVIMKGFVNSTPFLKGVLHKDLNLKTGRIFSHLSAFEVPGFEHLYFMTDGGLNIAPDVEQKDQILKNSIEFLRQIGLEMPKVALLSANELINEKMPVTVECKELADRAKTGEFGAVIMEGPLPLDLAISKESLHHKGVHSEIDGDADLLLVPSIEAGNIFGKSLTYFAKGVMAGVVLGAKVPLILNSRSDSAKAKLASIALAVVATKREM